MASEFVATQGDVMERMHLHFKVTRIDSLRMWLGIRLLFVVGIIIGTSVSCEIVDDITDEAGA